MDVKKVLGKRIQDFRKVHKLTQERLAEIVGIDTISLSKIETGKNYPTAENLAKIASILNVDIYELFITDGIKTNEELLEEIRTGIEKIKKDNAKLHILRTTLKTLIS